jgi:hypothetical protein
VAAIILWNTKYLERALAALPSQQNLVQHVTPLGWEHISLTGDYIWADEAAPADGSLRPQHPSKPDAKSGGRHLCCGPHKRPSRPVSCALKIGVVFSTDCQWHEGGSF